MATLKLYNYFRSSASYRARIALHHKGLPFEYVPVHLVKSGGEQKTAEYRKLNPMSHVPTLVHEDFVLAETMAIFDYLDKVWPNSPMFPSDVKLRARTIQICEIVNSGIQPLQNLKVTKHLENGGWTKEQTDAWICHWIKSGLKSLEDLVSTTAGLYSVGDTITAADAFIIPQLFAARRFKVDIAQYPTIAKIEANCLKLDSFRKSHPEAQPDYEK